MSTLTTRLSGLLRKMKGDKKVVVSPQRREAAVRSLEQLNSNAPGAPAAAASNNSAKPSILARVTGNAKREQSVNQLQEGFTEVVDLIRTVRVHLDQQADRSDRLLSLMENLPGALEAIPEASRNQSRMAESMASHADQQNKAITRLNETLGSMATASEHQSQVMGVLQQQIESSRRTDEQLLGSFSAVNQTLIQLSQSSQASVQTLRKVTDQSDRSSQRIEDLMRRNSRTMTTMAIVGWTLAATGLGTAAFALLRASGLL